MIKARPNSKLIFTGTFLVICLILMLISYNNPLWFSKLREGGYSLGNFFYSLSFNSKKSLSDTIKIIIQAKKIKKENELLKRKLNQLIIRQKNYYQEIEIANQRLRKLINLKKRTPYDLLPAKVLAYSPQDFFKVIYINKGKEEGVLRDMGVVNTEGLVGKVVEVYPEQAKVMLIIDKRSKIGVRVQRTRDIGILQGTGNPEICNLDYILTKAEVKVKDAVVTSGLGGIFPEGILVGYISSVEKKPNYIFQKIKVKPAVDFGKLEELFLIVRKK